MKLSNRAGGVICLIVAVLMFVFVFSMRMSDKKFIEGAEETTAYVTDVTQSRTKTNGKWKTTYTAHITYTVNNMTYYNSVTNGASSLGEGETVIVYYYPSNPVEIRTDADVSHYNIMLVGIFAFIVIGIVVIVKNKQE